VLSASVSILHGAVLAEARSVPGSVRGVEEARASAS